MLNIPYRPEKKHALKARFAAALRECVDLRECTRCYQHIRVTNIFDFIDGIRLFCRRELHPDPVGQLVLVCPDIDPGSHLAHYLSAHPAGRAEFERLVVKRYHELSGVACLDLWSRRKPGEKSVPYWYHSPDLLGLALPEPKRLDAAS